MSLLAMQRDFRDWLRHEGAAAAGHLVGEAQPGLLVYQNNYRAQLMDCLAGACEQVRAWIGDEAFFAAAATHVDRTPPGAWTLDAYPAGFPATLAEVCTDSPEVAELAWLEVALAEVFVGPDSPSMSPAALADISWDRAVLLLAPTARTRCLTTNAASIWSALTAGGEPPAAATLAVPSPLLIWRSGFTSCFRTMDADEAAALAAAAAGETYEMICARLVARHGEEGGVDRAGKLLGQWLRDGLVTGIEAGLPQ